MERALAINPNLAEAHCVKAHLFEEQGKKVEATSEMETAVRLDPELWEVNREAARLLFRQGRIRDSIPYFEKAASLSETDWHNAGMLISCYRETGDRDQMRRAAQRTVERTEKAIAADPSNSTVLAAGVTALAAIGEEERAKDWIDRALLLDPDNNIMGAALGGGGSASTFLDVEARRQLGSGWSAGMTARRGWTGFAAGSFRSSAYGFDLSKLGILSNADQLGFRISQPLRVEKGGFATWLPTSYDYATGTATNSLSRLSLTPSGREIDGEISYGKSLLGNAGWLGGNLFYRRQPGHIADAQDDVGAAVRFSLDF